MSLGQIAVLLDAEAPDRHAVLEAHLADLEMRGKQMELSRQMTEHALRCRAHDVANCPNFKRGIEDMLAGGSWPGDQQG